jgi:hypothetical protein
MKIQRIVTIIRPLSHNLSPEDWRNRVTGFLLQKGWRLNTQSTDAIKARRGNIAMSFLAVGDPRSILQDVQVTQSQVVFTMHCWYNIFLDADEKIVECEARQLQDHLSGQVTVTEAEIQKLVGKTTWQSVFAVLAVFFGTLLLCVASLLVLLLLSKVAG